MAGDGQRLRSTVTDAHGPGQQFVSLVRLYCQRTGLTAAVQDYTDKKPRGTGRAAPVASPAPGPGRGAHARRAARPKKTGATVAASGNDYVVQTKGNQPKRLARLQARHADNPEPDRACH